MHTAQSCTAYNFTKLYLIRDNISKYGHFSYGHDIYWNSTRQLKMAKNFKYISTRYQYNSSRVFNLMSIYCKGTFRNMFTFITYFWEKSEKVHFKVFSQRILSCWRISYRTCSVWKKSVSKINFLSGRKVNTNLKTKKKQITNYYVTFYSVETTYL